MIISHKANALGALVSSVLLLSAPAELPIANVERSEPVSFSKEILPLFKRSCVACHNATKAKAKLNLETVETILKGSGDGPVLIPGKADESLLFISATHREDPVMPPENNKSNARNLKPEELGLLKLWIDQGAKGDDAAAAERPVEFASMSDKVDAIYSVAISPDNIHAAAGRGNQIHLYHLPSGRSLGELQDPALADKGASAHLDIVGSLAFGGDGLLASGGFRNVKLWRRSENPVVAEFTALGADPSASAISPDRAWAVVADASGGISLYTLANPAEKPKAFKDHGAAITGVGFAADGRLVTASLDKTVKVRPAGGEGEIRQVVELPSPIHALAIVVDGTRAACACEDGIIRIVPIDGDPAIVELKGHAGKVTALAAFGEGGKDLLSGGADKSLKVWKVGQPANPLRQGNNISPVVAAVVTPDGERIATVGEDKVMRLWNGADLKLIKDLKTDSAALREQAKAEAALKVATGLRDGRKKALEAADKKRGEEKDKAKKAAEAEATSVTELATKLAALDTAEAAKRRADETLATKTAAKDPNLKPAQDAAKATGDALAKAQKEADDARRKRTETGRNATLAVRFSSRAAESFASADAALASAEAQVTATTAVVEASKKASGEAVKGLTRLAFVSDGALLVASAEDGNLYAWGSDSGAAAGRYSVGGALASMTPMADGILLAVGANKSVATYDTLPKWKLERTIGSPDDAETFADRVNAVAFSADGRTLATGGGVPSRSGELKVWRVRDGAALCANSDDHSDAISAVAFSPDGRHIATAATDRFVKVFSADDATFERAFEGHTNHVLDVAWRADGLALASSGADNVVKVWDYEAGTQKQTVKGHSKPVTSVAFVGAGETLLSSSGDKSVRLANQPLPDAGTFMHTAESSDDGAMIAAGGEDSILRIWRASDKKVIFKLQ